MCAPANLPLLWWEEHKQRPGRRDKGQKHRLEEKTSSVERQTLTSLETRTPEQPSPQKWATRRCRRSRAEPSLRSRPPRPGSGRAVRGSQRDSPAAKPKTRVRRGDLPAPDQPVSLLKGKDPNRGAFPRFAENLLEICTSLCSHWVETRRWCFLPLIKISLGSFGCQNFIL